jgi:hypothetical protein
MITYEYYFPEETPTPNPTPTTPKSKQYYIFKILRNENGKVDTNSLSQFVKFDNIDDLANYIQKTYGLSEVAIYDSPKYGEIKRENGIVIGWAFANSLEEIYSDNKLHFETMEFESKAKSSKVAEIEDLIDVLQPIADEGNQEALELIETLQDVLDKLDDDNELDELDNNEFKMGGKITKKQEMQNFIDEYLKEYEPFLSIRHKNFHTRMAKRQYNKKLLEQTPERYYDVSFRSPFGAVSTYRLRGKSGQDAFRKYNYTDVQGNRMKFISATLSRNQN